jgi:hypothetical protein
VSLYSLNLQKLLGSPYDSLVFNTELMINGRSFSISALCDTGADGSIFIDTALVALLCQQQGLRVQRLERQCPVNGFDGKPARPITHAVILSMCIEGHVHQQVPMLVADLGKHDLILGRIWLAQHDVLLDCRRRRMIWPHEPTLFEEVCNQVSLPTPITILKKPIPTSTASTHQADADRRDKLLEQSIDLSPRKHQDHQWQRANLEKMQRNLRNDDPLLLNISEFNCPLNISIIGPAAYQRLQARSLSDKRTEVFSTSLAEIDHILDIKSSLASSDPEIDEIRATLPTEYQDLAEVFSKRKSDELPPHRKGVDHDIILEAEA